MWNFHLNFEETQKHEEYEEYKERKYERLKFNFSKIEKRSLIFQII